MGRSTGSGTSSKKPKKAATTTNNSVDRLRLLRNFVQGNGPGAKTWSESELTDCLRQCSHNVERAAECLMTGQYVYRGLSTSVGKKTAAASAASNTTAASKKPPSGIFSIGGRPSSAGAQSSTRANKKSETGKASSVKSALPSVVPNKPSKIGSAGTRTTVTIDDDSPDDNGNRQQRQHWLLCQRWISHAVCMTRNGQIGYRERLEFTHTASATGTGTVRFRGSSIEGRLPSNLAALLVPLLQIGGDGNRVICVQGEALMEERRLPIGAHVPLSIRVYVENPETFFGLFESDSAAKQQTSLNMFFDVQNSLSSGNNKSRKRKQLPAAEAAFGLLQWAEHGDVVDFNTADSADGGTSSSVSSVAEADTEIPEKGDGADDTSGVDAEMSEHDFEDTDADGDDTSTAEGKRLNESVGATEWATTLPEAEDPSGLADGVTLRPYQRQALYWMTKREREGESRKDLEEQLSLLSELASSSSTGGIKSSSVVAFHGKENAGKEIICDCGPVLVSDEARKRSKTVDGEVNALTHPLWKQRFLASGDMKETLSFFVNELLGVATHRPPPPPQPCSGGILADVMGK